MRAVVLAAGKGTRMKTITSTIPKPMVTVNDKPILEYIITCLKNSGLTEIGVVVGYKKSIIQKYFGDGSHHGVSITYIEQKKQKGTGSALHLAKDFIAGESFFFTFGDVLTPRENYNGIITEYKTHPCHVLLGLNKVDDPYKGAAVYLDDNNTIIKMVEKPPKGTSTTNLNNAGLMVLSPDIFDYTAKLTPSTRGEYELTDVFAMFREDGKVVRGYILTGYWKDIGTPEDIEKMKELFNMQ